MHPTAPRTLCALLLAGCANAPIDATSGRTLYVAPAAGAELDDPSAERAPTFTTIAAALAAASSGDTIDVPAGTYTEDIELVDGVSVVGAGQGETYLLGTVSATGLSGASLSNMTLYNYDYYATGTKYVVDGLTVSGGELAIDNVGFWYFEAAMRIDGASDVDVVNSTFGYNWYGIVDTGSTDLLIANNLFGGNPAGGVATSDGGDGTTASIVHNNFVGNGYGGSTAYLTGALSMGSGGSETVANNIMTSNYYGLNCYSCGSDWSYNLVWGNTTDYVNDASADSTDLSADPKFTDSAEGDYSLKSTSPCIDAGTASETYATDVDGESRPQGDGVDIGMDEYASSAYDLVITEVMANAGTESTDEFVEIYNNGGSSVDLAGFVLTDGDDTDTLESYDSSSTTLAAGEYAVVVDPEYDGAYSSLIPSGTVLLTTGDTTIGNGLTTSDTVTLYESDGSTIAASFSHPKDPGDSISMELYDLDTGDASGNWRASQCDDGSSPGGEHCFPESGDPADLVITEVMFNASSESTGEYVEVYNPTTSDIDLSGLVLADGGGYTDTLSSFQSGSTLLGPGEHGLVVDDGYTNDYYLPAGAVLVTAGATLGNGLSLSDDVTLYDTDGSSIIDTFTNPGDTGDGISAEKIDYTGGDSTGNWQAADEACDRGASPARLNGSAGGICDPLLISEVMANADDEDTGEFIELYNAGYETIDLSGLYMSDGDDVDTLTAYDSGSTELAPGGYAVIVDAEYADEYGLDSSVILVTTTDTTLGNSLSVSDEVTIWEEDADGELHFIDGFLHPSNPGNAISIERVDLANAFDSVDNWEASTCAAGESAGGDNCVSGGSSTGGTSTSGIVITEIMANADTESTGEYVELYNNGSATIDLLYWVFYDGDAVDTILGFSDVYDTELAPGEYAVILDADYAGEYDSILPSGALYLTTDDHTLGSGLSTKDEIYIYEDDAATFVDSFTSPWDPGNATSIEKVDVDAGDVSTNWEETSCSAGGSPGQGTCP